MGTDVFFCKLDSVDISVPNMLSKKLSFSASLLIFCMTFELFHVHYHMQSIQVYVFLMWIANIEIRKTLKQLVHDIGQHNYRIIEHTRRLTFQD